jgi:ribosomal-protein-alanine N-acetyltransferase
MRIETKRLIIRDFEYKDYKDLYNMARKPQIAYYAGYKPFTDINVAKKKIFNYMYSGQYLCITLKDGTFLGDINFYLDNMRKNQKAYQLGFSLDDTFWSNGYMQEACKGFLTYIFKHKDIDIISCCHMLDNLRSEKTILALGFHYDGILYHYKEMYNGKIVDVKLYSLTHDELERRIKEWQLN